MQDKVLLTVTTVTDDSTGCYVVGALDFGIPGTTDEWLNRSPDNPKRLADWMRMLADRCENRQIPFGDKLPPGYGGAEPPTKLEEPKP